MFSTITSSMHRFVRNVVLPALMLLSALPVTGQVVDDFTDGNFTASPVWSGDIGSFGVITDATLPSGSGSTDGAFLASNTNVGHASLFTLSSETAEWRFSLGSANQDFSATNYLGVILMSDSETAPQGNFVDQTWNGYYLRLGANNNPDPIELWRRNGTTPVKIGNFETGTASGSNGLGPGRDFRVVRSGASFQLFYSEGFNFAAEPLTSGGTLIDPSAPHTSSNWFGVFQAFANPNASRRVYIDNVFLGDNQAAEQSVMVTLTPTSASVVEGGAVTPIEYTVITSDGFPVEAGRSVHLVLHSGTANATDFSTSFPLTIPLDGLSEGAYAVNVQTNSDATFEADEVAYMRLAGPSTNVTIGAPTNTFALTITNDDAGPANAGVVISELDADTEEANEASEFIELYGPPNTSLTGLVLVLFNGGSSPGTADISYSAVDLDPYSTDENGYFVICQVGSPLGGTCNAEVYGAVNNGFIQNGADAVTLYRADAAAFPNGTSPTTTNLQSALVYSNSNTEDTGLTGGLGGVPQYNENAGSTGSTRSLQRMPNGTFTTATPTPRTGPLASATTTAAAGWRVLGVPRGLSTAPTILNTLVPLNIVQGVVGEYPNVPAANKNVRLGYDGTAFVPAVNETDALVPGKGFIWYLFTAGGPTSLIEAQAIDTDAESFRRPLPVTFSATVTVPSTAVTADFDARAGGNGAYLLANPYPVQFDVDALSENDADALTGMVYVQADADAALEPVMRSGDPTSGTDLIQPWQGFFVEFDPIGGVPTSAVTFTYGLHGARGAATASAFFKNAQVRPELALRVDGRTATGIDLRDGKNLLILHDEAADTWDRFDGSKFYLPVARLVSAAFVGPHPNGAPRDKAVESRAPGASGTVAMTFTATETGDYRFTWDDGQTWPSGQHPILIDGETGTRTALTGAGEYRFTSGRVVNSPRFSIDLTGTTTAADAPTRPTSLRIPAFTNPLRNATRLTVDVPAAGHLAVHVVDLLGRTVATLHDGSATPGSVALDLDASALPAGVYVLRAAASGTTASRTFVVAR